MFHASHPHDPPPPGATLAVEVHASEYGRRTGMTVRVTSGPDWWASIELPLRGDAVTLADQLRRLADALAPDGGPD